MIEQTPEDVRAELVKIHGKDNVWNTSELQVKFKAESFQAPFCVVTDRATGKQGVVEFIHSPRFYFDFSA